MCGGLPAGSDTLQIAVVEGLTPEQIEQTIAAATVPYRTLFTVAALTGARISELCGLM